MRKSILIDEELHNRLKNYTAKQNQLLGKYVEGCINEALTQDELDERWIQLQKRWTNLINNSKTLDEGWEERDEYKQYITDVETYWNEK